MSFHVYNVRLFKAFIVSAHAFLGHISFAKGAEQGIVASSMRSSPVPSSLIGMSCHTGSRRTQIEWRFPNFLCCGDLLFLETN